MAKQKTIDIKSRLSTDELKKDVETAVKELNKVKDAAEGKDPKTGKDITDTKSKWGEFANLFSGTLPRDIQKTIRQFKAKRREVTRATSGMEKFNKVMGRFGGPVLAIVILALEKLVEYLPQIIDFFTGNTEAIKALTAANEAAAQSIDRFNQQNSVFFEIMLDGNRSLEERVAAQERLGRSIAGLKDINLEAADAAERLAEAYAMEATRQANEEALKQLTEQYAVYVEKRKELETTLEERQEHLLSMGYKDIEQQQVIIEDREKIADLEEEYAELLTERVRLSGEIVERDAEMNRLAEERQKLMEAEQRTFRINKVVYDLEREMRLERLDEYDREIAKLDEKEREQLMAADSAGATEEQLTTIYAYYAGERQKIRDREREARNREQEQLDAEATRAHEQLQRLQTQIAEVFMDDEERAVSQVSDRFGELIEQARVAGLSTVALEAQMEAEKERVRDEFAAKRLAKLEKQAEEEAKLERDKLKMLMDLYAEDEGKSRELRLEQLQMQEDEAISQAQRLGISELQVRQFYAKKRQEIEQEAEDAILRSKEESMNTFKDGMTDLYNVLSGLVDRESKNAKRLAVLDVLMSQGKALAAGIQKAVEATPATPGYPLQLAGYIASIAGTIITGFSQVKSIMSQAGAQTGAMTITPPTQSLVPSVSSQVMSAQSMNVSAYVVNSELQGQRLMADNMGHRITL